MDDNSFNIRVPKRWARVALIVGVTALIVAPLTAIASHSFTDVPDSNTFHSDIAWLADAGVTKGCNPPANTEYCPKDEVTREQMSAFMRRLAENKVVDAATAVQADNATTADSATTAGDADSVAGVVPAVGVTELLWENFAQTTAMTMDTFTVDVPAAGHLMIEIAGNVWIDADSASADAIIETAVVEVCTEADTLDFTKCSGPNVLDFNWEIWEQDADNADDFNPTPGFSRTLVVPVSAGTHTFYVNGLIEAATYNFNSFGVFASAVFVPGELSMSSDPEALDAGSAGQ